MSFDGGIKKGLVSIAMASIVGLVFWTDTASIASTASSTARIKVQPSIMTTQQTSTKRKKEESCKHKFVSFYMGRDDGSALNSQASAQCSSVYEIPAEEGSLIIIP